MANEVYSNENKNVGRVFDFMSPNANYALREDKDTTSIFDFSYKAGLKLMAGDTLLKPMSSVNKATIRKTSTQGVYKLILQKSDGNFRIKYIDESQLLNNKEYAMGTISKISDDEYEITYFGSEDEISIEHYTKAQAINFMKMNKLTFQL
ncbi:hypothetical protein IJ670_00585 [bacterium]|nr:hypothetical protein [bacterium]